MITQLNNRSLLNLNGSDTQSFLQGQFSNDIDALEEGVVQVLYLLHNYLYLYLFCK